MATGNIAGITSRADDFRRARRQAAIQLIMARLTGKSATLFSFDEVRDKLKLQGGTTRGHQEIPLDAIRGSVGRYTDFNRNFLPLRDSDEQRWVGVEQALLSKGSLPPIEVYQIGEVYFVLDGNHRVSVARQLGRTHIEAFVTEYKTKVPLSSEDEADDLIVKAEYANFLEITRFDKVRPEANLQVTVPGQYWELETHIEAHRFLMGQEEDRDIAFDEAVGHWYDQVYRPVVEDIQAQGLLRDFPGRTETDLYLWIFQHRSRLEKTLGWHIELEAAASDLVAEHSPKAQRVMARMEDKLLHALKPDQLEAGPAPGQWRQERTGIRGDDRLFADILVPLAGDEGGWHALDLALEIARRENSQIFALHIVSSPAGRTGENVVAVKTEFERRCREAGVSGELSIEVGKIVDKICERARWSDLVVMYPANPPGERLMSRLSSGSRNVIFRSCRPVLTVPDAATAPERVLLAYDGSPKAREGLLVATYLADVWQVALVILTVIEQEHHAEKLAHAEEYLKTCGLSATFLARQGNVAQAILNIADEYESDLIIMGGYGVKPIREAVLGSKVDEVLRESQRPILVCR